MCHKSLNQRWKNWRRENSLGHSEYCPGDGKSHNGLVKAFLMMLQNHALTDQAEEYLSYASSFLQYSELNFLSALEVEYLQN